MRDDANPDAVYMHLEAVAVLVRHVLQIPVRLDVEVPDPSCSGDRRHP